MRTLFFLIVRAIHDRFWDWVEGKSRMKPGSFEVFVANTKFRYHEQRQRIVYDCIKHELDWQNIEFINLSDQVCHQCNIQWRYGFDELDDEFDMYPWFAVEVDE